MFLYVVSVFQLCPVIMWARASGADETDWHHDQSSEEGVGGWDSGHGAQAEKWEKGAVDFQESHWTEGPGGAVADPSYYYTIILFLLYCFYADKPVRVLCWEEPRGLTCSLVIAGGLEHLRERKRNGISYYIFAIIHIFITPQLSSLLIIDRNAPQAARRSPAWSTRVSYQIRAAAAESPGRGETLINCTIKNKRSNSSD